MSGPDLTVVIPAYRAEAFIGRAIRSVIEQPRIDPEIIVVVDGIFDSTAQIAAAFPKTRVLINETNQGAPAARNRGLAEGTAPYVMFLDADDWIEGELLLGLLDRLAVEDADLAFGPLVVAHFDGRRAPASYLSRCVANTGYLEHFLRGSFVPPCATMWRTTFLRANGGWRHGLRRYQDYELVLRSLILGARTTVSDQGGGITFQHLSKDRVSADTTRDASIDRLNVLRDTAALTKERQLWNQPLSAAFESAAYHLLRDFARHADEDVFTEAAQFWRQLGGGRHFGSLLHRLSSLIFGLRKKEQIAMSLARIRHG